MKKKILDHFLAKEAKKLPPETYEAYPREFGLTLEEEDRVAATGKKIEDHWYQTVVDYPKNHARRLKQSFKDEGWQGVVKYFNKRGFQILNK